MRGYKVINVNDIGAEPKLCPDAFGDENF